MDGERKPKNEQMKGLIDALGAVAEMSLVFYRDTLGAGATPDEAFKLTQAFIAASLYGNNQPKQPK